MGATELQLPSTSRAATWMMEWSGVSTDTILRSFFPSTTKATLICSGAAIAPARAPQVEVVEEEEEVLEEAL